ncbi:MAG: ATP-binding protein [Candidatus Dojkabacteria bacterium]|nr:ATP-binding protein [Candidatus Dojkabacteria bacterium]
MKFIKSLKFKLTIWYSVLLSLFCIIFVVGINLWLNNYMQKNIGVPMRGYWGEIIEDRPLFKNLTDDQITIITESRLADLSNIRDVTLYSIIPLVLLSFVGGYIIADIMLRPLTKLKDEIKSKSTENLGEEIEFTDNGDEISELIKSFNIMSRRLGKSFDSQKEFVENASHELKTPLAIIQASLDTALEDGTFSKEELREVLESSKENVKFMNQLTEDLLLFSVLEQKITMEDVNLKDVVNHSIKDLEIKAKEKGIEIKKTFDKSKLTINANPILLQRAVMNILENAIKYSEGSEINIEVKKIDKDIELLIQDNGKGIPKKHLDKIFERFYRVDKSRSRETGGSGLGLAITKGIIEKSNGEISVESIKNKGTSFKLIFRKE